MKIQFTIVGTVESHPDLRVDLPAVPREGETVKLPGLEEHETIVRTVVWYPLVDDEDDETEPFVYVVLGRRRSI